MAEITRTRDHDPYGDVEYCVEWEDNDGIGRERYFKSQRAAERYTVQIEVKLLNEAVQNFKEAMKLAPEEKKRQFMRRDNASNGKTMTGSAASARLRTH
jgi:hypothetical protein